MGKKYEYAIRAGNTRSYGVLEHHLNSLGEQGYHIVFFNTTPDSEVEEARMLAILERVQETEDLEA